jgi:membrane protein implicated in regulation of membrane protease activity
MELRYMEISYYWFILCVILFMLEVLGASGIGLFFGGIAACLVGLLVELKIITAESFVTQWSVWFFITGLIAVILYKPIQKWRTNPNATEQFNNIIGTKATVGTGGLMLGKPGKVHWSGTLMNAAIIDGSAREAFLEGEIVEIADVRGNQLLVKSV